MNNTMASIYLPSLLPSCMQNRFANDTDHRLYLHPGFTINAINL